MSYALPDYLTRNARSAAAPGSRRRSHTSISPPQDSPTSSAAANAAP